MWNPFSSSLQICGDAGHSIRDAANTEVYRKYVELYNNFQRFQQDFKEGCTRFQGSCGPLETRRVPGFKTSKQIVTVQTLLVLSQKHTTTFAKFH